MVSTMPTIMREICDTCANQNVTSKTCLDNFEPETSKLCLHYTGKIGRWLK